MNSKQPKCPLRVPRPPEHPTQTRLALMHHSDLHLNMCAYERCHPRLLHRALIIPEDTEHTGPTRFFRRQEGKRLQDGIRRRLRWRVR